MSERTSVYLWAADVVFMIIAFVFIGDLLYLIIGLMFMLLFYLNLDWQIKVKRMREEWGTAYE
jgi:hypothetical protein